MASDTCIEKPVCLLLDNPHLILLRSLQKDIEFMMEFIIQPDKLFEALLVPGERDGLVLSRVFDLLSCLVHLIEGRPDSFWIIQDYGVDCSLERTVESDHLSLNEIP